MSVIKVNSWEGAIYLMFLADAYSSLTLSPSLWAATAIFNPLSSTIVGNWKAPTSFLWVVRTTSRLWCMLTCSTSPYLWAICTHFNGPRFSLLQHFFCTGDLYLRSEEIPYSGSCWWGALAHSAVCWRKSEVVAGVPISWWYDSVSLFSAEVFLHI